MGVCQSAPRTITITIEDLVLDPPFERDIIKGIPVVYVKQGDVFDTDPLQPRKTQRTQQTLLTFTTIVPLVVDVTAMWNQSRHIHLRDTDPSRVYFVVGENPRYRGTIDHIREVQGEVLVDIDEYEGTRNLGRAGVLRVEVTQNFEAPPPPPTPVSNFGREGYRPNLNVFLYEAKGLDRRLVTVGEVGRDAASALDAPARRKYNGGKNSGSHNNNNNNGDEDSIDQFLRDAGSNTPLTVDVDLVLYNPKRDYVKRPRDAYLDRNVIRTFRSIDPTWNEGFTWRHLDFEPRFLDVRFNPTSNEFSRKATCRIDLLGEDVWGSSQDWRWHPILADDRSDQRQYRVLLVDDSDQAHELHRVLSVLGYEPVWKEDAQEAFDLLSADSCAGFDDFDLIFVNVAQHSGMDGLTFTRRVREAEARENLAAIPIIGTDTVEALLGGSGEATANEVASATATIAKSMRPITSYDYDRAQRSQTKKQHGAQAMLCRVL